MITMSYIILSSLKTKSSLYLRLEPSRPPPSQPNTVKLLPSKPVTAELPLSLELPSSLSHLSYGAVSDQLELWQLSNRTLELWQLSNRTQPNLTELYLTQPNLT